MVDDVANEAGGNFWSGMDNKEKLRIYLGIVVLFVLLALIATFAEPHASSSLARCNDILLVQSRYSCLYSLAVSTKNSSICGSVAEPLSDECYSNVAELTLDPGKCTGIADYNMAYSCVLWIANKTDSYRACDKLSGSFASSCIESLASERDNATACNAITNQTEEELCSSGIYLGDASMMKNASYCALVQDTDNQNQVSRMVSLAQKVLQSEAGQSLGFGNLGPLQYIEESGGGYSSKEVCYLSAAAASNNASSCYMISNETLRDLCNTYGYQQTTSSNATQNATVPMDLCAGESGANLTSCEALSNIVEAVTSKNLTKCADITDSLLEYQCYTSMAYAYNDTTYCGYIQNATANQACMDDIYYNES